MRPSVAGLPSIHVRTDHGHGYPPGAPRANGVGIGRGRCGAS